ncbi:hypothetical protein [Luteirhabdus pelagi]|uniref:hypothetical protein n=1 Tax=Luteirhabdus pelagi TaxID=2792783 RepID=UPI00193AAB14|nr:hypothetical protein [Luteirhabdus pelagi]
MKTTIKFVTALVLTTSVLISCSEDESNDPTPAEFSVENNTRSAQTDNVVEGTLNIMETAYVESEEGRSVSFFPDCATIVFSPNGNGGTIEITFENNCELNNGAIVSGTIFMEYGPIVEGTRTIDYTFEDYFYNGNGVTGGGEIFREIENDNGNPQSTVNETIMVSFPNTTVTATRDGLRIAEWVEGVGSGTWTDNVYSVTGNWETNLSNGFFRNGEVTQPLIRKLNCPYLVEGSLQIEQQFGTGVIDFGEGECDSNATITINGQEFPIQL